MLKSIRNARVNLKTGIFIIVLAVLMWAVVAYVGIQNFVPEEFTEQPAGPGRTP